MKVATGQMLGRTEIDYLLPDGQQRYLGVSVSPLRSRDPRQSGYVFNFQDLTDLHRLEREVAVKERMSALGRLSAAIAHEIRQPLTAIAGAVKELGRLVPLEDDERRLVGIVARESERLNATITDFLSYSREKTYEFQDADVRELLDETLTLLERKPEVDAKYRILRAFNGQAVHAKVDVNRITADALAWCPRKTTAPSSSSNFRGLLDRWPGQVRTRWETVNCHGIDSLCR